MRRCVPASARQLRDASPRSAGEDVMSPESTEYQTARERSLMDPAAFWAEAAGEITWFRRWDRVLDASRPPFYRWFTGGVLNTCYNAVDRHVARGRGRQTALIYDSPVTGTVRSYTYDDLLREVAALAGALHAHGL